MEDSVLDHEAGARLHPRPTWSVSVSWLSSSCGFRHDLAYFRQVFREFISQFPDTSIHIADDFPVDKYPELPLKPDFRFVARARRRSVRAKVPYAGFVHIPTVKTIGQIFREKAPLIVVVEFIPTAALRWLAAKLRRRRVLLLIEGDPSFRGAAARNRLVEQVKRLISRHCDAIQTSNSHGERYVIETLRVPKGKVVVGPYLTSGPTVQDLVADRDLTDSVEFRNRVSHEQTPQFYAWADVVVCPTLADYRSLAGIEAVNAGRGVVVSKWDGASDELPEYSSAAWLIDPLDIEGSSKILLTIIEKRDETDRRLRAAQSPPHHFSLAALGDNFELFVEQALR